MLLYVVSLAIYFKLKWFVCLTFTLYFLILCAMLIDERIEWYLIFVIALAKQPDLTKSALRFFRILYWAILGTTKS